MRTNAWCRLSTIVIKPKHNLIAALPDNQAAYQPGSGTIEQIQIVQQIIERANEYQQPCVICFVDNTKTFDSIDQGKLWGTLRDYSRVSLSKLASLYESCMKIRQQEYIHILGTLHWFLFSKVLNKGDISSAMLFLYHTGGHFASCTQ